MPREVRRQIFCFLHYQGVYSQNQIIPSQMLPQISGIPENNFRSPWAKRDLRNARDFRKFSRCSQRKFVWLFIFKYVHIFFGLAAPLLFRELFSFHLRSLIRCRTGAIATPPPLTRLWIMQWLIMGRKTFFCYNNVLVATFVLTFLFSVQRSGLNEFCPCFYFWK